MLQLSFLIESKRQQSRMRVDDCFDDTRLRREILDHIKNGRYRLSKHAAEEQALDGIDLLDTLHILKTGRHETEKTLFDNEHQNWKYAIRGKTEDSVEARVIIAFSREMMIVTVIGL